MAEKCTPIRQNRKRSFGSKVEQHRWSNQKIRRYSESPKVFKDGGTYKDPLNLLAINDPVDVDEKCKKNRVPNNEQRVLHPIPIDMSDPLKLNCLEDDVLLLQVSKKRKKRKRRNTYHAEEETKDIFAKNDGKNACLTDTEINLADYSAPVDTSLIANNVDLLESNKSSCQKRKTCKNENLTDSNVKFCDTVKTHSKNRQKKRKSTDRQSSTEPHFRAKDEKFRYGNYNRYYGYRNPNMEEDKRICMLKQGWFEDKSVLDIGCNVGHLTIWIAKNFYPESMLGVDIDMNLIKSARSNICHYISEQEEKKYPVAISATYGPLAPPVISQNGKMGFPYNIKFVTENYTPVSDEVLKCTKEHQYDTISCFSVTKWIQLNWGDEGLKRFFKKVYRQLKPGGLFLMEVQPLSSYSKKKNLTPEIRANYNKMQLMPENFIKYLLSEEVGFEQSKVITNPHKGKGFQRPIFLLTKSRIVASRCIASPSLTSETGENKVINSKVDLLNAKPEDAVADTVSNTELNGSNKELNGPNMELNGPNMELPGQN